MLVGQRIRQRRMEVEKSQRQLGDAIGVKFQQIQKYESGKNRVSSSKLWEISQELGVPVSYFFETSPPTHQGGDAELNGMQGDPLLDADARALALAFLKMPDDRRKALLNLARVMRG